MIFVPAVNLIVQKEIVKHPLQSRELPSFEPGKHIRTQRHIHPFAKTLRFRDSHLTELWPDGNARIGCEDIWGKTNIWKLTADVAHGLKGSDPVGLGFAGIPEDQIEGDTDTTELCFARGLVHLINT